MPLAISRRPGESVIIAEMIVITVAKIDKGQVRLAIDAPKDLYIRRAELPNRQPIELNDNDLRRIQL